MLTPNDGRLIVELVKNEGGQIIMVNQSSDIGENLKCAKVVHPGESKFKKGQLVAVMEYSLGGIYKDIKGFQQASPTELNKIENMVHVIAEADIVAYDSK